MPAKILIVDDEPDIQLYLEAALEDAGYEVRLLAEDEPFMATVRAESPSLICLDILMPRRSGLSLFRKLQADETLRQLPVVLISGVTKASALLEQDVVATAQQERGGVAVLEKPIQLPALLETVARLLAPGEAP